ncbi:bicyclomycin resistance protein [Antarctobacter heliothermus]|uniref:Bcr/CflA family efflux transporter n=1 Tax=Antarctobacter heliothermus TaxID=74033 RepID=A0A222DZR2_9RHOB|nr:multidrug effflux MFS transporter [Antarctobacter heliothermus]ASP19437.1 bicyclomycin resistance protein [Antarctobacter heliothermus]
MNPPVLTPKRAVALTAVLGLLSIFPPLATDMYLAAMGTLADAMNASHASTELSLSLFFLGLCFGQLLIGPLIDGYGRKGPLLAGTALFAATSIALPLVNDIAIFNGLRFVQAIGASAGMVVGRTIVNDLYQGQRAAKVMTVLVMLLTIGPIVSPTLGSLLLATFGWQSIFVTMASVSLVALVLSQLIIPETLPADKRTNTPFRNGRKSAATLLTRWSFVIPAVMTGLIQGGMFAFITGSSGVFQGVFGLSALSYGLVFALIAAALILFGQLNSILLNRFTPKQILSRGLPIYVLATLGGLMMSGTSSIVLFVIPLWISVGMVGLLSANVMSIAMAETRDNAGMGSALLGAIQFAIAFTVSTCVALGGTDTPLAMSLGLLLPACAALLLSLAASRNDQRAPVDA